MAKFCRYCGTSLINNGQTCPNPKCSGENAARQSGAKTSTGEGQSAEKEFIKEKEYRPMDIEELRKEGEMLRKQEEELRRKLEEQRRQKEAKQKNEEENRRKEEVRIRQEEESRRQEEEKRRNEEAKLQQEVELHKSVSLGDAKAQHELAMMYLKGTDFIEKDANKAAELLEKAAEQGDIESQYKLGLLYRKGSVDFQVNNEKAFYWLEKAANNGHAEAQEYLGGFYIADDFIQRDINKALFWWEKAANQGNVSAMMSIANIHNNGQLFGFDGADINVALKWLNISVNEHKNPQGMIELGVIYCEGANITRDHVKGISLINKGLSLFGNDVPPFIYTQLGILYLSGKTTKDGNEESMNISDYRRGIEFFEKAIASGHRVAELTKLLEVSKGHLNEKLEIEKRLKEAKKKIDEHDIIVKQINTKDEQVKKLKSKMEDLLYCMKNTDNLLKEYDPPMGSEAWYSTSGTQLRLNELRKEKQAERIIEANKHQTELKKLLDEIDKLKAQAFKLEAEIEQLTGQKLS